MPDVLLPDFYRTAPHGPGQPSRFAPISTPFPLLSPHQPGPARTTPDGDRQAIGLPQAGRAGPAGHDEGDRARGAAAGAATPAPAVGWTAVASPAAAAGTAAAAALGGAGDAA
jgi:hypothetical protein